MHCFFCYSSIPVLWYLLINSLENKSTGPSSIPVKLLRLIPDLIIIPLAYIINMSLKSGVYHNLLKLVKVVPIHKRGSTQDINNYRPTSLLSIFDKIIEKLMHKRLYTFLEDNNMYVCLLTSKLPHQSWYKIGSLALSIFQ